MPRPSQFAVGKLKSYSFIELWYFTEEGCSEAQETNRTLPEDAYGITRVDDLVALKPVTAFKASKNAIPDADLTWRQMNIGKNTMLRYMETCDWPRKHIESFARFYLHLELDPMRSRPNGERVLLTYQAKVRRQWHDDLSRGQGFNIAQINHTLLASVAEEVWDTIRLDAMRKFDAVMLSPTVDRDRSKRSSPHKRGRAHSRSGAPSHSRSRSRSFSPSRQRRRRYPSPDRTYRSPNPRRSHRNPSGREKGKGGDQAFFQRGTAARGGSACAVCLGRHEHEFGKCSAPKLWNGGKTWVRRGENGRLVSLDGLPICFTFQTPAGCSDTTHPTRHTCSGCGKSGHGAQLCPLVQKA